jgi:UDP-N-acetylglucosamine:LPS N-acetylglucosamine transferase
MKRKCILVAGGTGGHINAALGLGQKLTELQFDVLYLSGMRPLDYKLFKNQNVIHLQSQPLRSKSPVYLLFSSFKKYCDVCSNFM